MLSLKLLISTATTTTTTIYLLLLLLLVGKYVAAVDKFFISSNIIMNENNSNIIVNTSTATAAAAAVVNIMPTLMTHAGHRSTTATAATAAASVANVSVDDVAATYPNATRKLQRGKRYLQFAKGSRMSWRATVKNNILNVNTLWGYGFGFRANYPFPGIEESRRPFFKRDVFHALEDVLDGHGFDGRACILKSFCTALLDTKTGIGGGMLFKLLKMIFTLDSHDKRHFPYLRMENCEQILHSHCPLSFNNISPYTDDV